MKSKLKEFLGDESGATAIEYGLLAIVIAIAVIAAFTTNFWGIFSPKSTPAN